MLNGVVHILLGQFCRIFVVVYVKYGPFSLLNVLKNVIRLMHKIKGNKNRSIGLNFLYDRKNRLTGCLKR